MGTHFFCEKKIYINVYTYIRGDWLQFFYSKSGYWLMNTYFFSLSFFIIIIININNKKKWIFVGRSKILLRFVYGREISLEEVRIDRVQNRSANEGIARIGPGT